MLPVKLKKDIVPGPTLAILDPYQRFYIKIDWSKDETGAVLLQADYSLEARNLEAQEKENRKCEFDKSLEEIFLQPIYFISRSTVSPLEKSRHRFLGEEAAARW